MTTHGPADFAGQHITVAGLGVSGISAARVLAASAHTSPSWTAATATSSAPPPPGN